jgi:hypothetical protein
MKKNVFARSLESRYVNSELWEKIQRLDLTIIFERMTIKHGWTEEKAEKAVSEYRKFLYLTQVFEQPVSPTNDIDAIWHEHILHTNKYALDCKKLFGKFLHHFPTPVAWKLETLEKVASCAGGDCEGRCSNDSCDSGTTNCGNTCTSDCSKRTDTGAINFDRPNKSVMKPSVSFQIITNKFFLS